MKYFKLFENESEYQAYIDSGEMTRPNVSYIKESDRCIFNPIPKAILNYDCPAVGTFLAFINDPTQIRAVKIDGEDVDLSQIGSHYFFTTSGKHTVEMELLSEEFGSGIINDSGIPLTSVTLNRGVTKIGYRAFQNCSSLKSINIPDGVTTIENSVFYNCTSLTSINIPDGVTKIGNYAFGYCSSLTSIDIPDSVTTIDSCAFSSCTSLVSINIPDGITDIGSETFRNCSSLKSITIPDSVATIGNRAFYICTSLSSITCNATVAPTIYANAFQGVKEYGTLYCPTGSDYSSWLSGNSYYLGYYKWNAIVAKYNINSTSSATTICGSTLPFAQIIVDGTAITPTTTYNFSTSGEHEVVYILLNGTKIEDNAFKNCQALTSVDIPDSVTYIGSEAFRNCTALTSITIPDSVTYIGSYAFSYCSALTSITIPDGVTNIANYAFYYCTGLTSITIPDSVTTIGAAIFGYCSQLVSITIPNGVTAIGNYTFMYCTTLTSITIPDSVTTIGQDAFRNCTALTSITIPDSVTTIAHYAFKNCTALSSITCNATVAPTIYTNTFQGVKEYGTLYYPKGSNYSSWLSGNSDYLGYYKWNAIVAKYNITSTSSSTTICGNTSAFTQIIVDGTTITPTTTYTFSTTGEHEVVYILNGTTIGDNAFKNCSKLTSVVIPDGIGIITIGNYAFQNCSSLTSVDIPNSVRSIGSHVFYNCTSLTSINIPYGLESIGGYALYGCTSLTSIDIPNSVRSIGSHVFYNCTSLESINIPYGVTSISLYAFYNCSALTSVVIPDSVTRIGSRAFYGCTGLASIYIPDSITEIENYAFYGCSKLSSITCNATVAPTIYNNTFYGVKQYGSLYYPTGSDYSSWLSTSTYYLGYYKWNVMVAKYNIDSTSSATTICGRTGSSASFSKIIIDDGTEIIPTSTSSYKFSTTGEHEVIYILKDTTIGDNALSGCSRMTSINIPNNITSIGDYAFSTCTGLTSITIPDSVTTIGYYAFNYCQALTSVDIPNSVTSIGDYAFYQCLALTSVKIPNGVTSIKQYTFHFCKGLTSVVIPNSVTTIGNYAFSYCQALTSITIPDSVTTIGNYAFQYCKALTSIYIPDSVTSIGNYAFQICEALTSITCNATVAPTVYANTFYGVKQYGSLCYPKGSNYSSWLSTNSYYLGYYKWNTAIVAKYNINSTSSTTRICYSTSSFSNIVVDGASMNPTGTHIFSTTGEHEVIYILKGTTIGSKAFFNCNQLASISIPYGVTNIGSEAFRICLGLTSIDIPNSVTTIGDYAFYNCSKLASITIPDSVTTIGDYAFMYCNQLSSITCNATVAPTIYTNTFRGVRQYGSLYYPKGSNYSSWLSNMTKWNTAIVAKYNITSTSSATTICGRPSNFSNIIVDSISITPTTTYTFSTTGEHEVVYILNGTTIGNYAFQTCTQMTSISIPNGVTKIGSYAFYNCTKLTSITIPDSVTTIGDYAFYYCTVLTSITIPDSVTYIGNYAFYYCSKLTSIDIPYLVTYIGYNAFMYCSALTSITIPDSVTYIGSYAFHSCSKLTSITIPDSVTYIGNFAFYNCSQLASITCNATVAPTVYTNTFQAVKRYGTICVPIGSNYSSWFSDSTYYLGYYQWKLRYI